MPGSFTGKGRKARGEIRWGGWPPDWNMVQCQVAGCGRADAKVPHAEAEFISTGPRHLTDLSRVPFAISDMDAFNKKVIYYESSRGCPFILQLLLSPVDKGVTFPDLAW